MNRQYTVVQAIDFLNEKFSGYAPKNEETLRRAIRTGRLKAQVRRGKEGSLIREEDLLAYGSNYALRMQAANTGIADFRAAKVGDSSLKKVDSCKCFADIIRETQEDNALDFASYKLRLIELRRQWTVKEGELRAKQDQIQTELKECQMELELFEKEILDGKYYMEGKRKRDKI